MSSRSHGSKSSLPRRTCVSVFCLGMLVTVHCGVIQQNPSPDDNPMQNTNNLYTHAERESQQLPYQEESRNNQQLPYQEESRNNQQLPYHEESRNNQQLPYHEESRNAQQLSYHEESRHTQQLPYHEESGTSQQLSYHDESRNNQKLPYHEESRNAQQPPYHEESRNTQQPPYHEESRNAQQLPYNEESRNNQQPPYHEESRNTQQLPYNEESRNTQQPPYHEESRNTQQPPYHEESRNAQQPPYQEQGVRESQRFLFHKQSRNPQSLKSNRNTQYIPYEEPNTNSEYYPEPNKDIDHSQYQERFRETQQVDYQEANGENHQNLQSVPLVQSERENEWHEGPSVNIGIEANSKSSKSNLALEYQKLLRRLRALRQRDTEMNDHGPRYFQGQQLPNIAVIDREEPSDKQMSGVSVLADNSDNIPDGYVHDRVHNRIPQPRHFVLVQDHRESLNGSVYGRTSHFRSTLIPGGYLIQIPYQNILAKDDAQTKGTLTQYVLGKTASKASTVPRGSTPDEPERIHFPQKPTQLDVPNFTPAMASVVPILLAGAHDKTDDNNVLIKQLAGQKGAKGHREIKTRRFGPGLRKRGFKYNIFGSVMRSWNKRPFDSLASGLIGKR